LRLHLLQDLGSIFPILFHVPRWQISGAQGAAPGFKVAVLGAAGGIGQPLSLLLKMNPLVSTLHLYDVFNTPGVTADLSHTNTSAVVCC
jgi:malate dehydrogenase